MTEYKKSGGVSGAWAKPSEIENGTLVKLVSECEPQEGEFGTQNVAKARLKGSKEPVNIRINKTSINGLIDAYGTDSKLWMDKVLTTVIKESIIGGREVTIMYLVPEGFVLGKDDNGYLVIKRAGEVIKETRTRSTEEIEEEIDIDSVPF